jgi:hypothetical protein
VQSKGNRPTAAQQRWQDAVANLGSILSGEKPVQLHHAAGFTARHNKVLVGPWWIIPLTKAEHDAIPALGHERKAWEKRMFTLVCWHYQMNGANGLQPLPFGDEVTLAIQDWHL